MSQLSPSVIPVGRTPLHWVRVPVAAVGAWTLSHITSVTYLAGALCGLLWSALLPRTWSRTVRRELVRQIMACGVESLGFVCFIAILTGMSVVLQAHVWLSKFGLSDSTGPLLVTLVIRELGPLVVNFVVIARSGNVIATELGQMKFHGELRALEIQGIDPGTYLALPRVLGLAVSVFCLSIFFSAASLVSGWFFVVALQRGTAGSTAFVESIANSIGLADIANVLAKTLVPALLVGIITCTEGMNVGRASTDVAHAAARAIKRSVIWVFVIFAAVSALTYA